MTGDRNPYDPLPGEYATGGPIDPSMAVPGLSPAPNASPAGDPWSSGDVGPGGMRSGPGGADAGAGAHGRMGSDPMGSPGMPGPPNATGSMGDLMMPPAAGAPPLGEEYASQSGVTKGARSLRGKPITQAVSKPPMPASALLVPTVLLLAGGAGAMYLGNVVGSWPLGGLAGALGLVGALFSFVMLRG